MKRLVLFTLLLNFFCNPKEESNQGNYNLNGYSFRVRPYNQDEFSNKSAYDFYNESMKQQQKGNVKEALALLTKANSKDPNNKIILNSIGALESHLGNYKRSLDYLSKAITIDSTYLDPLLNMSLTYIINKDFEKAILMTDKIIETSNNTLLVNGAYFNRSIAEFHLERYEDSLKDIDYAIKLCGQDLPCSDLMDFKKKVSEKLAEQTHARSLQELLTK